MSRAAWAAALAGLVLACGGPAAPSAVTTSLRMSGSPPDARVTIDEQMVGTLDVVIARGVALPPGKHRISVEAPGYFPMDTIVEAKESDRAPIRVDARLVPVPE